MFSFRSKKIIFELFSVPTLMWSSVSFLCTFVISQHELQKELQRVTALEIKNEQQQKILRRKNEEIASAKRRLRNGSGVSLPPIHM